MEKDANGFTALNDRLNLGSINYPLVERFDFDTNIIPLDFEKPVQKSEEFTYNDKVQYQNNYFVKRFVNDFTYKNDPTRWNLHLIQNRIQSYFLNKQ